MSDITSLLLILTALAFCVIIIRILGRIISWRITLPILAVAILTAYGLLNIQPITDELGHLISNLFGTPNEGSTDA